MIEQILLLTGALVWAFIGITIVLWSPLVPFFAVGWVAYKTDVLWLRDICMDGIYGWTDHVLKPVYDPILNRLLN